MTEWAILAILVLCVSGFATALLGFRWQLRAFAAEADKARLHELALRVETVKVDQAALDEDRAKVKRLEERVKTLEFRTPAR